MTIYLTQHSTAPPPSVAAYRQSDELAHRPAGQVGYCSMRMAPAMGAARRLLRLVEVYPLAYQPAGPRVHVGQ